MWLQNVFKRQLGRENKCGKDYEIVFISYYLMGNNLETKSCLLIRTPIIEYACNSVNTGMNMMNRYAGCVPPAAVAGGVCPGVSVTETYTPPFPTL